MANQTPVVDNNFLPESTKSPTSKELLKLENSYQDPHLDKILNIKASPVKRQGRTYKVPQSSVLQRVKRFLPDLEAANKKLENLPTESVNIENVEDDQQVIQMDIALVAQPTDEDSESDTDTDSESDSDSEDSGSSKEEDSLMKRDITEENLVIRKTDLKIQNKRVLIEEMNCTREDKASVARDIDQVMNSGDLLNPGEEGRSCDGSCDSVDLVDSDIHVSIVR